MLASYSNVRLLGYVHTTYATRNISLVRRDIETYAAWPNASSNPDLTVRGIFFDETPQEYSDQSHAYLQNLTDLVKGLDGFGSQPFVSFNFPVTTFLFIFVLVGSVYFPSYVSSSPRGFLRPMHWACNCFFPVPGLPVSPHHLPHLVLPSEDPSIPTNRTRPSTTQAPSPTRATYRQQIRQ